MNNDFLPAQEEEYLAGAICQILLEGFDKHYRVFQDLTRQAKGLFERMEWVQLQTSIKRRIRFYDDRVMECVARLNDELDAAELGLSCWQRAKLLYIGHLISHKQPELAETFFNSVTCKILHRDYFNNDFIFVRPGVSTEYIESQPPVYRCYYAQDYAQGRGLPQILQTICRDCQWGCTFENLRRDVANVLRAAREHCHVLPAMEFNFQVQVLHSPFYRNNTAYIIGKVVNGYQEYPFAMAVRHTAQGQLYIDTILLDAWRISSLFSLSRSYFMVDMEVPSGYVDFLHNIMPIKSRSELYTMVGLQKQGKTMFYRDLIHHLQHSDDLFTMAPGIPGMVMLVFTMPSYAYVFKVIKDDIPTSKDVDRQTVMAKYQIVKEHDRVGRMVDSLEFSNVAFPKARFSQQLLDTLRRQASLAIVEEGENLVIHHLYIERRMTPLNIYLEQASAESLEATVKDYGNAIREMAQTNIFPGDMLWKNFGVTRYGRVVFYDYDEIEYLTHCNFRKIPSAPDYETEMSGEVWYSVARNDVFPEEFAPFLLGNEKIRSAFLKYHQDLLDVQWWQQTQQKLREGNFEDFFPYPHTMRFCNRFHQKSASEMPMRLAQESAVIVQ